MKEPDLILHERLTVLGQDFIDRLESDLGEIKTVCSGIRFNGGNREQFTVIHDIVHRLEIDGVRFGLLQVAAAAHHLSLFLQTLLHKEVNLEDRHYLQIDLLVQLLRSTIKNREHDFQTASLNRWKPSRQIPYLRGNKPLILILEEQDFGSRRIASMLKEKGYDAEIYHDYQNFRSDINEKFPALIISDSIIPDRYLNTDQHPGTPSKIPDLSTPVIFIAYREDVRSHLAAVRNGCVQYFQSPFKPGRLVDTADLLINGSPRDPYRVLVIDTDRIMTDFYSAILQDEGMHVKVVNDPLSTIDMIKGNRPELILVNADLEGCSGLELTTVIRQRERLSGLSIIFLSTEADIDRQLATITTGGDDLITVPVDPQLLITTINSRIDRARTLNKLNYDLVSTLRELENQQFALNQHAIVSVTNINGAIIYVNDKFCEISGYSRTEILGRDYHFLRSDIHDEDVFREMWQTISKGEVWQGEICNRKKSGEYYWLNITVVPFLDEESRLYQFVSISSDITARIEAEQNMIKARDAAVMANQTKSEFLSKMSHELRTPLNAVMGFSQLLDSSSDSMLTANQRQYIKEIQHAGAHLLNLINEVLDLSRIEANQLTAENITIPLSVFLDECYSMIIPLAREKNISILKNYEHKQNTAVYADPVRLKQVMVNLLSNAIKYNSPSGSVLIQAQTTDNQKVILEVIDTGEGIDESQKGILFEPFTRLPQHKNEEGVGIGLALSKRLCELMGGKIGVDSEIGRGSRFWIELEQAEYSQTSDRHTDSIQQVINRKNYLDLYPYKILYIEDNLANYRLVSEILEKHPKISFLHSETATAGIAMAKEHGPDLILMDLQLPGLDGFEALQHLRTDDSLADIPVIAISAFANDENIHRAHEEGFAGYITKPINISGFLLTINRVIEKNQLHIR